MLISIAAPIKITVEIRKMSIRALAPDLPVLVGTLLIFPVALSIYGLSSARLGFLISTSRIKLDRRL